MEWKRRNTSYEKPRPPAFGEVSFWLFAFFESEPSVLHIRDASCFQGLIDNQGLSLLHQVVSTER